MNQNFHAMKNYWDNWSTSPIGPLSLKQAEINFNDLPDRDRFILESVFTKKVSFRETGRTLGITGPSVACAARRALKRFRKKERENEFRNLLKTLPKNL